MRLFFLLPGFVVVHAPALFPSSPLHLEQKVLGTLCGRLYLLNIAADLVSLRCTPPPSVPIIADTLRRARRSARGMKIHQQLQLSRHRISLSCPVVNAPTLSVTIERSLERSHEFFYFSCNAQDFVLNVCVSLYF